MMYAADGSWNVTVLDPLEITAPTGLYASDGSVNVVQAPSPVTAPIGAYHPCGALYVTVNDSAVVLHAPDGSLNVTEAGTGEARKVTVVAGAFA